MLLITKRSYYLRESIFRGRCASTKYAHGHLGIKSSKNDTLWLVLRSLPALVATEGQVAMVAEHGPINPSQAPQTYGFCFKLWTKTAGSGVLIVGI